MNKILLSLAIIAVVAAIGIGATVAYFSDTEASIGNTFTAGELDITIDSTCHYDGMICQKNDQGAYVWVEEEPSSSTYPDLVGDACTCSWLAGDLVTGNLFFNFEDVKPGDEGESTISLHAAANDSYVCVKVDNLINAENGCTEPEDIVDATCDTPGKGQGELQNNIHLKIWKDSGIPVTGGEPTGKCDNIWQPEEEILVKDTVINNNSGSWALYSPQLGALKSGVTECIGVAWSLPGEVENIVQGDSVTADISFYAEQARNNEGFSCDRVSKVFVQTPTASNQNQNNKNSQRPYIDYEIDGQCIDFTFVNPTPYLFLFDYQVDNETGYSHDWDNVVIHEGECVGQLIGPAYNQVSIQGVGTVDKRVCGQDSIKVGLREGAEQSWYIDWIPFVAQPVAP